MAREQSGTLDFIGRDRNTLVTQPDVLRVDYIPDEVLYRQEKIDRISKLAYQRAYQHGSPENILVFGPPGTGKTLTLKFVNDEFKRRNDRPHIKTPYINCEGSSTTSAFYKSLLNKFGMGWKKGLGVDYNVEKLFSEISQKELTLLVIMDEIDALRKRTSGRNYLGEVLYKLLRPEEIYDGFEGNISVIGVSNDLNIKKSLDESVKSSLQPTNITFEDYTRQEIVDILMDRQKKALSKQVIPEQTMNIIARAIINDFHGDVRAGLRVLRDAAFELEDYESPDELEVDEVKQVIEDSVYNVRRSELEDYMIEADDHFLFVVYAFIASIGKGEDQFKPIHKRYEKLCELARVSKTSTDGKRSKSFVRRKLDDMDANDILNKHVEYNRKHSPCTYTPVIAGDILQEVVEERLKHRGLYRRMLENADDGLMDIDVDEDQQESIEDKANQKLNQLKGSADEEN